MSSEALTTPRPTAGLAPATRGLIYGLIGVIIFGGSLPATRAAVLALDPWFVSSARAVGAALLGMGWLLAQRAPLPSGRDWLGLVVVGLCVVVGFPVLTGLAMQWVPASHGILFVGLIPLATCLVGALLGTVRPRRPFWLWAAVGAVSVAAYAILQGGGDFGPADLLMVGAIAVTGIGYAEGARLSHHMKPAAVISWALVVCLPLSLPALILTWPAAPQTVAVSAWIGLGYVTLFSMFIGFLFWYRGLVLGGTARVSQIQLFQPFIGLGLAAVFLGEQVGWGILIGSVMVTISVAKARRYA
ncbi:DMT family transporter [Dongia rigui]|uniref:DMT family transporter n=1 Tax=Dongia rigui TaxID=940149 RepID=A0ABU5E4W4_9PROT|nr:DMT family transporter [Dongia rigui]MDY0873916.1 DMT family transporter [Dongia rigui]